MAVERRELRVPPVPPVSPVVPLEGGAFREPVGLEPTDEPLGAQLKGLVSDATHLIRQEVQLAKLEIRELVGHTVSDVVRIAVAAGLAVLGGLALTAFLVIALGALLGGNYWLSALLVGVLLVAVGGVMARSAVKDLKTHGLKPDRTVERLQDDARWAKREAAEFKRDVTA